MGEVVVNPESVTMREARLIKDQTGKSLMVAYQASGGILDEEMMTALVWVTRLRDEPELTYGEVEGALTYGEFIKLAERMPQERSPKEIKTRNGLSR